MRILIASIVLISCVVLGSIVYRSETAKREMKEDLVELLKVKYGLFNVDEWKRILTDLIRKKVDELEVTGVNREEMRQDVSRFLNRAVNDFEAAFHREKSQTLQGSIQSMLAKQLDVFSQVRNYIPTLTEQVLDFLNDPSNRDKVKTFILQKLDEYTAKTFAETDYTVHNQILAKHGFATRDVAIPALQKQIDDVNAGTLKYLLLGIIIAYLLWTLFSSTPSKVEFVVLITICFTLLLFGVLLPMIEIDARISSISFQLLGERISFTDQVLYYKSKSILEVVRLMLTQGRTDVFLVGILVLVFSVLFPVSKLVCSVIYQYVPTLQSTKWLNFVVFKTGKWSMADVMVVAIFMAYIGFGGIISEQLRQLSSISANIDILTTNQSSLQVGFFLFTSFTILSLVATSKLPAKS